MKEFFGSLFGIIVVFVVLVLLGTGATVYYWNVIAPQNATGQYNTNRNSQQYQDTKIAHERDLVTAYNESTSDGQKISIKAEFCSVYADITNVPSDIAQQHQLMCS